MVEGRVRTYYMITPQESLALQEAKQKIAELVHEVLEEADDVRLHGLCPSSRRRQEKVERGMASLADWNRIQIEVHGLTALVEQLRTGEYIFATTS